MIKGKLVFFYQLFYDLRRCNCILRIRRRIPCACHSFVRSPKRRASVRVYFYRRTMCRLANILIWRFLFSLFLPVASSTARRDRPSGPTAVHKPSTFLHVCVRRTFAPRPASAQTSSSARTGKRRRDRLLRWRHVAYGVIVPPRRRPATGTAVPTHRPRKNRPSGR